MKHTLTIAAAKLASAATRSFGRGSGAALPGLIAEKWNPEVGAHLAAQLPHGVILVTGTNGKTTTTKLLADALEKSGERVLNNRTGSNLRRGVLSALIQNSSLRGKTRATIGLFEVDEASLRRVVPLVNPKLIVVLNLFRDQLDRYGELDTTAALIGEGIAGAPKAKVVLNADDPLVASLAKYANVRANVSYFGIEGLPSSMVSAGTQAIDSDRCPICGRPLEFSRAYYAHIGHYRCTTGDFDRPQPEVALTNVKANSTAGSRFEVSLGGKRHEVNLPLPGVYNLYNALGALAAARVVGVEADTALQAIEGAEAAFGRVETLDWRGRKLSLLLIKNPTGCAQILETFLAKEKNKPVLIAINDNYADGRDVSWLWDVPFELLAGQGHHILTSGVRADDMALRLKYAQIQAEVEPDLAVALEKLAESSKEGDQVYVLPTYTAMLALRKLLQKEGAAKEVAV
jgi:UDP-N-acetylmuramyl tripeptide synthase